MAKNNLKFSTMVVENFEIYLPRRMAKNLLLKVNSFPEFSPSWVKFSRSSPSFPEFFKKWTFFQFFPGCSNPVY